MPSAHCSGYASFAAEFSPCRQPLYFRLDRHLLSDAASRFRRIRLSLIFIDDISLAIAAICFHATLLLPLYHIFFIAPTFSRPTPSFSRYLVRHCFRCALPSAAAMRRLRCRRFRQPPPPHYRRHSSLPPRCAFPPLPAAAPPPSAAFDIFDAFSLSSSPFTQLFIFEAIFAAAPPLPPAFCSIDTFIRDGHISVASAMPLHDAALAPQ